jgi:TRAP-type uncharacterized transport system substrate-binding protein
MLWATALVFAVSLLVSAWLIGSPPPRRIRLATGDPQGGFAALGRAYKARLDRMGLRVELVGSTGSLENLDLLRQRLADVAFVQGGLASPADGEAGLCGLAAVDCEPLWIFSREPVSSLKGLRGARVALGPPGSGSDALGRLLLREYGVTEDNTTFLNGSMAWCRRALADSTAGALLLVCSADAPAIDGLLERPDVRLVGLRHQQAIVRRLPYLRPVILPEGALDLGRGLPPADTPLVAPVTLLAAREDLHPRVVEQLLLVAKSVHSARGLLGERGQFPTLEGMDLPAHITAERFTRTGESFLSSVLPYRAMRLVWQAQLLVLPLLTLLPLWRALPWLYTLRINQILKRHYAALRDAEARIEGCTDPEELRRSLEGLDGLRADLARLSRKLPAHTQNQLYDWRLHVAMAREEAGRRLRQLEAPPAGPLAEPEKPPETKG